MLLSNPLSKKKTVQATTSDVTLPVKEVFEKEDEGDGQEKKEKPKKVYIEERHKSLSARAFKKGEEDGLRSHPSDNDPLISPYEEKIRSDYQRVINELGVTRDKRLSGHSVSKVEGLKKELEDLKKTDNTEEIKILKDNFDEETIKLKDYFCNEKKHIENKPEYQTALDKFRTLTSRFNKLTEIEGRITLNSKMSIKLYWVVVVLAVGVGEVALNYNTFVDFGINTLLTFLMAICLALAFIFITHMVGLKIKQRKENPVANTWMIIIGLLVALMVTVGLAELRIIELMEEAAKWDEDLSPEKILGERIFFYGLGFLLLSVGVGLSYMSHDSSGEFEEVYKRLNKAEKEKEKVFVKKHEELKQAEDEYHLKNKSIKDSYFKDVADINGRVHNKSREIENVITIHNETLEEFEDLEKTVNSMYHSCVQNYRDQNIKFRVGSIQPASWHASKKDLSFNYESFKKLSV